MEPTGDSRAPYLVVADDLRSRIAAGEFPPGAQLPPGRTLAAHYSVAPNTVLSALRSLRDAGLVVSQQGRGTFVRRPEERRQEADEASGAVATISDTATLGQLRDDLVALRALVDDLRSGLAPNAEQASTPDGDGAAFETLMARLDGIEATAGELDRRVRRLEAPD